MIGLRLALVVLSLAVLGAHFLRAGRPVLVALALAFAVLAFARRPWVRRVLQAALVVGAVEWARTLAAVAARRLQAGEPVVRLVAILGGVAVVALVAALLLETGAMRRWYSGREANGGLPGPRAPR